MKGIQRVLTILCLSAAIILCFTAKVSANYGEPFNYYVPAPSKILENVEKYHLNQGVDKVKQGKYEYAWSEFAFMLHYFPNHPKALEWLGELAKPNEKVQDWRIRVSLSQQDWWAALQWIEALPEKERNSDQWRYWRARILELQSEQ